MVKLLLLISLFIFITYTLSSQSFGLFPTTDQPPELLKLETQVKVEGESYARIQYDFIYKNPFNTTIETKFVFPPTRNAIFHKFEATIQNQTITSKVIDGSVAHDSQVKNCNLGFPMIPPNETVYITFIMIQPLGAILSKFYELRLPAFINEDSVLNDTTHWNIQIELESTDKFVILSNPTHRLVPTLLEQNNTYRAFWNVTVEPNKEFTVYFGPEDMKNYTIHIPNMNLNLFNVVPKIKSVSASDAQKMLENTSDAVLQMKKYAVQVAMQDSMSTCFFVIDRSDSMKGSPIQLLKKTLKVILRDFAPYCKDFHMVSFGSSFEHHNSTRSLSGLEDIQETIEWVDTIEADMGGSNLLQALRYIDGLESPGNPQITVILTDGDVTEPYQVQWGFYFVVGIGGASKGRMRISSYKLRSGMEFAADDKNFGDQEIFNMLHKLNPISFECEFTFTTGDNSYQNQPFYKSNRYWVAFSKEDTYDVEFYSSKTNLKICDSHHYWDSCQYGLASIFSQEDSIFELQTKSFEDDIWKTLVSVDKRNSLEDIWRCCEFCDDDEVEAIQQEILAFSLQHQILSYGTAFVLQTKTSSSQADTCDAHSSGFFDLSKFNNPSQSSQGQPVFLNIPRDYIPLDSIQNAVPGQTESIDL